MTNIDTWRSQNRPSNKSLPGLLEKLNIIPSRPSEKDESALDTLSESSIDGGPAHSLPVPVVNQSRGGSHSPTPSFGGGSGASQYGSLSKANPFSPGRRASMVHHKPSESVGEAQGLLSRLTIVRAPSRGEEDGGGRRPSGSSSPVQSTALGSAPLHSHVGGGHSREGSGSLSTSPSARMSFAFSSFGQSPTAGGHSPFDHRLSLPHSPGGDLSSSLSSSHAGIGPGGRLGGGGDGDGRSDARDLTPREVVELARRTSRGEVSHGSYSGAGGHRRTSSTASVGSPQVPSTLGISSGSTGAGGSLFNRHRIVPQAPTFPDRPAALEEDEYEPVEFHPLEDDVMLPFDDRPAEVKALIEAERNRGLFKLLKLALPTDSPTDARPADWSYADLERFLTATPRERIGDRQWVATIRKAVEGRSEPLWEKLKGLLGIDEADSDDDWSTGDRGAGGNESGVVLIEGLEEGQPSSDEEGLRGSISRDQQVEGMVAGGMFSPEAGMASSLPSLSGSLSHHELEAIGESDEDEPASIANASPPTGSTAAPLKPVRQHSTDSSKTLFAPLSAAGPSQHQGSALATPGLPTFVTTEASPSSSFVNAPGSGLMDAAAAQLASGDVSPLSQPLGGFAGSPATLSGQQTPSAATQAETELEPDRRPSRRSFVGVSIVATSSPADYHEPHLAAGSPSGEVAASPSFPTHQSLHRRTSVTHDDLQYGGNEASDPLTERGPGNPLFPSSFSNLSLKPWSRTSTGSSGSRGGAHRENDDAARGAGGHAAGDVTPGGSNRDWARQMIGIKAGEKLSNSALTVADSSEYSASSSGKGF